MEKPRLTRKKIADQSYALKDPRGLVVATVTKTGSHLDDYPWEWSLNDTLKFASARSDGRGVAETGVEESLRACVDTLAARIAHYGLTK